MINLIALALLSFYLPNAAAPARTARIPGVSHAEYWTAVMASSWGAKTIPNLGHGSISRKKKYEIVKHQPNDEDGMGSFLVVRASSCLNRRM
jgi:hypothetical protein